MRGRLPCRCEPQTEIDLVLLGVCLPGMDGPAGLAAPRRLAPGLPCCFLTGGSDRYSKQYLIDLGGAELLDKPLNRNHVSRVLRQTLNAATSATPR